MLALFIYAILGGEKMELTINEKDYKFIFGYGFLKELNKKNKINAQGIAVNAGIEAVATNLASGDIETLVDTLRIANATETPRVSEKALAQFIEENGADELFDDVFEELKKSAFTKKKVTGILERMEA